MLTLVKATDASDRRDVVNNIQLAEITQVSTSSSIRQQSLISKQVPMWTTKYEPVYGGTPPLWRMAINHEGGNKEELVATVQGILYKKDLPPFQEKIR